MTTPPINLQPAAELPMLQNMRGQPASHAAILLTHQHQAALVQHAVQLLRKSGGRLIFSGMGASLFAAIPAVLELAQNGCNAILTESSELLHYGTAGLRKDDTGILISRSGGSIEVLTLAEKMRAASMHIIALTNVPGSALEQAADLTLPIGARADQIVAVQTYTGTLLKLQLLVKELLHPGSSQFIDHVQAALPLLTTFIDNCIGASTGWRDIFDTPRPLYLLGRGTALASAQEGALLLHETAKASAIAMSSGQFRHGPVEAVDAHFRGILFGAPEPTRSLDRALLNDLAAMGATVRWIGPSPARDDAKLDLIQFPGIDPLLAPLFDIVPLQAAAYRLAGWRNIIAGDFRYASEITSAESGFPRLQGRLASA